jgi:hypothetical protein
MFPNGNGGVGGTDFSKMRPGFSSSNTSTSSYTTVVSVQGSGIITSIAQYTTATSVTGAIRLTIDGVVVIDDTLFSQAGTTFNRGTTLSAMFAFNQSFLLEHMVGGSAVSARSFITYLLN